MFLSRISYLQTLKQLLMRGFVIYKPQFKDQIINGLIWSGSNIIIFAYIMPLMGLSKDFGPFILFSLVASWSFFSTVNNIAKFITDITTEGSNLTYQLTLPVPQWIIFAKYALENAYQAFIISLLILPAGKLLLWDTAIFEYFSILKFYFIVFVSCIFFGFFSLLMSSIVQDIYKLDNIWLRIIFPLWFFGGFQFSWQHLYSISPTLAYLNLLNPLTYALEGSRAAALDPSLSLPYWPCVGALLLASALFGYIGINKLKQRLDCL